MAVSDTESITGIPDIRSSLSPTPVVSKKRKRDEKSSNSVEKTVKRKKKRKVEGTEDGDLDVELGLNTAIGRMDSQLFADYVAQRTKRFSGDLSLVELEDKHIPGTAISFLARVLRMSESKLCLSEGLRCRESVHRHEQLEQA